MIHPVMYEEYKRLHDERAERLQREAQVHAWLRGQRSQRKSLRLWISEQLSRSGLKVRSAGSPDTSAVAPS